MNDIIEIIEDLKEIRHAVKNNESVYISIDKKIEKYQMILDQFENANGELPINDDGYVYHEAAIDYNNEEGILFNEDYPVTRLNKGKYLFVITNDIRYLETTYSIGLNVSVLDWRFVNENAEEQINFGSVASAVIDKVNFGFLS